MMPLRPTAKYHVIQWCCSLEARIRKLDIYGLSQCRCVIYIYIYIYVCMYVYEFLVKSYVEICSNMFKFLHIKPVLRHEMLLLYFCSLAVGCGIV